MNPYLSHLENVKHVVISYSFRHNNDVHLRTSCCRLWFTIKITEEELILGTENRVKVKLNKIATHFLLCVTDDNFLMDKKKKEKNADNLLFPVMARIAVNRMTCESNGKRKYENSK